MEGLCFVQSAHAADYVDSIQKKEYTGVKATLPYSVTTDEYNFTFYPKRAYVQPNQEITYELGIINKQSSTLHIQYLQVDVYRYAPTNLTGFGTFYPDSEVAIQSIRDKGLEIPGWRKSTMTFRLKVPPASALGSKKEICLGSSIESDQDIVKNQIAVLNSCIPIVRDAKQLTSVKSVFEKVYKKKSQNVDLEYWVPRYIREKMNAKTLETTMKYWKQKATVQSVDAHIKSSLSELRVLAEVYYDSNKSSYRGVDACIANPNTMKCKNSSTATLVQKIRSEIATAIGGASDIHTYASMAKYCVSQKLQSGLITCFDSTGTFVSSATTLCSATALQCIK